MYYHSEYPILAHTTYRAFSFDYQRNLDAPNARL
jgi:hypothetical protein